MSPRVTHEDDDMVLACPECDQAGGIHQRKGNGNAVTDPEKPYYCEKCKSGIGFVIERESREREGRAHAGGKSGLGLEDLSPEDVGLTPLGERREGDA